MIELSPSQSLGPPMSTSITAVRSRWSVVFLLHVVVEAPFAIQGIWTPTRLLPFLQLNDATLVILKLYSALVLATCLMSGLCYRLPEYQPGKRALGIGLCAYHSVASTILLQAPRFIPYSFGPLVDRYGLTPEIACGICHCLLGLGLVLWWQTTDHVTDMARADANLK